MSLVNPEKIIEAGILTGEGYEVTCNGIDLTIKEVYKLSGPGILYQNSKELPSKTKINAKNDMFNLIKGNCYDIITNQHVKVPENMAAWLIQRSTLNRMGGFITSGLYDSGFENYIGCVLHCRNDVKLEKGARIAQIIFIKADPASLYQGQYQSNEVV